MELVRILIKLCPPFVSCPNMPLQGFILHMMLMYYQKKHVNFPCFFSNDFPLVWKKSKKKDVSNLLPLRE